MSNTKDSPMDYKQFEGHTPEDQEFKERFNKGILIPDDELLKKCGDWVSSLCKSGGKSWCLSVPVRYDVDPDMLFTELIIRYQSLKLELQKQEELNAELMKCLKEIVPLAEDGYILHRRNGSHQEFLSEDRETISLAESLIKKSSEI